MRLRAASVLLPCLVGVACSADPERVDLKVYEARINSAGTVVAASVRGGGCAEDPRLVLDEGKDRVLVSAIADVPRGDCDSFEEQLTLTSVLSEPIGTRTLSVADDDGPSPSASPKD